MSKKFLTWTLILAFATCHSPSFVRADGAQEPNNITEPAEPTRQEEQQPYAAPQSIDTNIQDPSTLDEDSEDDETPVGTPVNPANPATSKSANRQFWTNILIAGVAVVVAVVSILVVSNNNGKKQ